MLVAVGSELVLGVVTVCHGLGGYTVVFREPASEVGHLAALAAEGREPGQGRTPPTIRAHRGVGHQDILPNNEKAQNLPGNDGVRYLRTSRHAEYARQ